MYQNFDITKLIRLAQKYDGDWLNEFPRVIEDDVGDVYIPIWYVSGAGKTDLNKFDFNLIDDGKNTPLLKELKSLGQKKIAYYHTLNQALPAGKRYQSFEIVFNVGEIFN